MMESNRTEMEWHFQMDFVSSVEYLHMALKAM